MLANLEKTTLSWSAVEMTHANGVGIIMKKEIYKSIIGRWPINDRTMMIKVSAQSFNINIIQLHAPTSTYNDEEVEESGAKIQHVLQNVKSDEIIIVMGHLNAKIDEESQGDVVDCFGLGESNERRERLVQFCTQNNSGIMNTFEHSKRRLYTWKSADETVRNQIDFIMINNRFKNSFKDIKTSRCRY